MSLDKKTVAKVANLARIRVEEDSLDTLADELNNILGWVEQLAEVDTDGVAPMTSVADMQLRWRKQRIKSSSAHGNSKAAFSMSRTSDMSRRIIHRICV